MCLYYMLTEFNNCRALKYFINISTMNDSVKEDILGKCIGSSKILF